MASEGPLHLECENAVYEDFPKEGSSQPKPPKGEGSLLSTLSSITSRLKFKFLPGSTAYKYTGTSSYSDTEVFLILRDFLQPDTTLPLHSVLEAISELLPNNAPLSNEVWSLGVVCLELAQQIPYSHSSQQKLARLLCHLSKSEKVNEKFQLGNKNNFHDSFSRLADYINQLLTVPSEKCAQEFINLHAFVANLYECHIFGPDPTYAIWAMHDAFELKAQEGLTGDTCTLIAAQWILWNGHGLFMQIRFLGYVTAEDEECWESGELYDGEPILSLHRWRFWKDGFKKVTEETSGRSDECKTVSAKAAHMMEAYEKTMLF